MNLTLIDQGKILHVLILFFYIHITLLYTNDNFFCSSTHLFTHTSLMLYIFKIENLFALMNFYPRLLINY